MSNVEVKQYIPSSLLQSSLTDSSQHVNGSLLMNKHVEEQLTDEAVGKLLAFYRTYDHNSYTRTDGTVGVYLFYFILFYFILFYFILFYFILFYFIYYFLFFLFLFYSCVLYNTLILILYQQ